MMRYRTPRLAALGAVALVLELTALDALAWRGARPELLLLLACYAAIFARDPKQGAVACWTLGLIKDLGSAGPVGWHALLFLGAGMLLTRARQLVYCEHVLAQMLVAASGVAAVGAATTVLVSCTAGAIPAGVWASRFFGSTLLTALLAPIVLASLARTRLLGR